MANKHIGPNFDEFLATEGILEEAEAVAKKRVFAFQLEQKRKALKLQKQALAKRMGTSRAQVDRVLDPENDSLTFKSMVKAASALGLELSITLAQVKKSKTIAKEKGKSKAAASKKPKAPTEKAAKKKTSRKARKRASQKLNSA